MLPAWKRASHHRSVLGCLHPHWEPDQPIFLLCGHDMCRLLSRASSPIRSRSPSTHSALNSTSLVRALTAPQSGLHAPSLSHSKSSNNTNSVELPETFHPLLDTASLLPPAPLPPPHTRLPPSSPRRRREWIGEDELFPRDPLRDCGHLRPISAGGPRASAP